MNISKSKAGFLAVLLTIGLVSFDTHAYRFGLLPPCGADGPYQNCELFRRSTNPSFIENTEYGPEGTANGLSWYRFSDSSTQLYCMQQGKSVASYGTKRQYNTASSFKEVKRICEPIRQAAQRRISEAAADLVENRLDACDSFGFKRGTEAHAECAMKLYMNEQREGATRTPSAPTNQQGTARSFSAPNAQQAATLARQQAIQEATLKEQKRVRDLEASLRLMQFGVNLMNGTRSQTATSKTHSQTYSINGQIIRCTTTGSFTTCF